MKKISLIVPCYNEEDTIEIYYNEIIKYFIPEYEFHIIFVDDGSKDKSLSIMKKLALIDNRVHYVSFSRNFGKESAMYAGLEAALKINSNASIIMDVDLQDDPRVIKEMITAYEEGYNLVYTKHKDRKGSSKLKAFCSVAFYKLYAFITKDKGMARGARDFSLMDRKVIKAFLEIKDYERFTKGIFHYVGFKTKCIEFDYQSRVAGTTKWNYKKLFHYAFLGIREFSRVYEYIPKILAWLTFFLLCFDLIYGAIKGHIDLNAIRLDVFMLAIFICLFYLFRLVYDIRKQAQNRPLYITEDTNIEELEDETK